MNLYQFNPDLISAFAAYGEFSYRDSPRTPLVRDLGRGEGGRGGREIERELGNLRSRPKVRGGRSDTVTLEWLHSSHRYAERGDRTARTAAIRLGLAVAASGMFP